MNILLGILNERIDYFDKKIDNFELTSYSNISDEYLDILKRIKDGEASLVFKIDEAVFKEVFEGYNLVEEFNQIKMLKTIYNLFYLSEEQKDYIISFGEKYYTILEDRLKRYEEEKKLLESYKLERDYLLGFKKRIASTDEYSYDLFIEVLDNLKKLDFIKTDVILKIVKELNREIYKLSLMEVEEAEEITPNDVEIDKESLTILFSEYGYDFNLFKQASIKRLTTFGNLTNIESILEVLAEGGVKVSIKDYGTKFVDVLIMSNRDIVNKIIQNIKHDSRNYDDSLSNVFENYLRNPQIFIKGGKRIVKNHPGLGGEGGKTVSGAFQNYSLIREYILKEDENADINKMMNKCGSIFVMSADTFIANINKYKFYGMRKEFYLGILSSLKGKNSLDIIDIFRELGCSSYIAQNPSRAGYTLKVMEPIFLRMALYNKENIPIYSNKSTPSRLNLKQEISKLHKLTDEQIKKLVSYGYLVDDDGTYQLFSSYQNKNDMIYYDRYEDITSNSSNDITLVLFSDSDRERDRLAREHIKILDENYMDPSNSGLYNIDGVLISRYKVQRYYDTLLRSGYASTFDSLLYVITRGSILTKEEYFKIVRVLRKEEFVYTKIVKGKELLRG